MGEVSGSVRLGRKGVLVFALAAVALLAGPPAAAAGADKSLLYNAAGGKLALEVTVAGGPTGLVFNGASGSFLVGTTGARFIFSTEAGTIAGWNGGPVAAVKVDRSEVGAVYKGLAIATTAAGAMLYASDFHNGRGGGF